MQNIVTHDRLVLPRLGLGTWPMRGEECARAAQIALKWLLDQPAVAAIPKAGSVANQRINLGALKVTLDDADRALINALPKNQRLVSPDFAPAWDACDE